MSKETMWTSQVYWHHGKMARTKTHRTSQNTEYSKTQQTLRNNYFCVFFGFFCFCIFNFQLLKGLLPKMLNYRLGTVNKNIGGLNQFWEDLSSQCLTPLCVTFISRFRHMAFKKANSKQEGPKGPGSLTWEKDQRSQWSHLQRTSRWCYTLNMKALGLLVSDKKMFENCILKT